MTWFNKDRVITASITVTALLSAFMVYSLSMPNLSNTAISGGPALLPNSTFAQAMLISPGDEVSGVFSARNNVDTYKFNISQPSNVTFSYTHLPPNVRVQLYDPSRQLLGESVSYKGVNSRIGQYSFYKTGLYYIRLATPKGQNTISPYTLSLDADPIIPTN